MESSKPYTTEDTMLIITEIGDTLIYSKSEFNSIVDNHPELYTRFPINPDQLYYCNGNNQNFGSEAGQDTYYILYAFFLKQKNGKDKYAQQRNRLIDMYSHINSLFGHLQYGGTYFGHQRSRILGYTEYSIYLLSRRKDGIEKTNDITTQKGLYIQSLRQIIEDESKIDPNSFGEGKIERVKKLNMIVDNLDELIIDDFSLRRAQAFHYEYY